MYYITDIRAFLTIAQSVGYKLRGNYCVKEGYRDRDWNYQIKVNLLTGQIDICAFMIVKGVEIKGELDANEYPIRLRDIDYLVEYRNIKKIDG